MSILAKRLESQGDRVSLQVWSRGLNGINDHGSKDDIIMDINL